MKRYQILIQVSSKIPVDFVLLDSDVIDGFELSRMGSDTTEKFQLVAADILSVTELDKNSNPPPDPDTQLLTKALHQLLFDVTGLSSDKPKGKLLDSEQCIALARKALSIPN